MTKSTTQPARPVTSLPFGLWTGAGSLVAGLLALILDDTVRTSISAFGIVAGCAVGIGVLAGAGWALVGKLRFVTSPAGKLFLPVLLVALIFAVVVLVMGGSDDSVLAMLLVPSMIGLFVGMIVFAVINRRSLPGVPPQWRRRAA